MRNSVLTVEEAKELVIGNTTVLETTEVLLGECPGLVLAQDIISPIDLPMFTNSAVDGYALKSSDIVGAGQTGPVKLEVISTIRAGEYPSFSLGPGECAKIMTGAPVPKGADSVVMIEDTEEKEGILRIMKVVRPKDHMRFQGEEIQKGEVAIESGVELNTAAVGFIAEMGIKKIKVYRKPKLAVVVSGEELAGPDEDLVPGKIRDSNSIILSTVLSQDNTELLSVEHVKDEIPDIKKKLIKAIERCDVVIITGGVSVGEYDYVKGVLEEIGVQRIFWRVSQRPGGPLYFGKKENTLVFGLPGNPASVLVCYFEYVRAALNKMIGKEDFFLFQVEAILTEEIRKTPGKTNFVRGRLTIKDSEYHVKPSGAQGSHILKSFALSNCLIVFPKDETHLQILSKVSVHILPS
ncbi:MAG: molybdopterin molybdotransferase MoeA [Candidatus Dadabacteria bacterium]|nr:molybdopterin molybdotransferase MoeA [Candidatus Dadabacteria bacterium]